MKKQRDIILFYYDDRVLIHSDADLRARIPAPLGLLYVATVLEDHGYKVEVVDARIPVFSMADFFELLQTSEAKIVGFYTYHDYLRKTGDITNKIKDINPQTKIFLGGPGIGEEEEKVFAACKCDVVVRCEGEYAALELADYYLKKKGDIRKIKGISFKGDGNAIIKNEDRQAVKNLDGLPMPRRDFLRDYSKYYMATIVSSRGCPYECTFCVEARSDSKPFRLRSAENVVKEAKLLVEKYGQNYISFLDDTFVISTSRARKICDYFKKEMPKDFIWWCEARVNILANDLDLIRVMKDSGLVMIQIGIESGNQMILDAYKKNVTLEQIETVVKKCAEEGLLIYGNFIIGGPYETEETINKSIEFACKLIELAPGYLSCSPSFLSPFPSIEIVKNANKYGIKIFDPAMLNGTSMFSCSIESESLNREKMIQLQAKFMNVVFSKMMEQLKKIPKQVVDKNFSLSKYGFGTLNTITFKANPLISQYYDKKNLKCCKYLGELKKDEIWDLYPERLVPLVTYKGNNIFVTNSITNVMLDGLEVYIYELSSGKVNFRRIVDEVSKTKEGQPFSREEIVKRALELYRILDENWLIVFYEF